MPRCLRYTCLWVSLKDWSQDCHDIAHRKMLLRRAIDGFWSDRLLRFKLCPYYKKERRLCVTKDLLFVRWINVWLLAEVKILNLKETNSWRLHCNYLWSSMSFTPYEHHHQKYQPSSKDIYRASKLLRRGIKFWATLRDFEVGLYETPLLRSKSCSLWAVIKSSDKCFMRNKRHESW